MRKLSDASFARLAEIRDSSPAASPVGLTSIIRSGLARAQLTPAGLFASRTGFIPCKSELTLLKALERGVVWKSRGWRTDASGHLCDAPDTVLNRFEQHGLASVDRRKGNTLPYRATDAGRELVTEMVARFGEYWTPDLETAQ